MAHQSALWRQNCCDESDRHLNALTLCGIVGHRGGAGTPCLTGAGRRVCVFDTQAIIALTGSGAGHPPEIPMPSLSVSLLPVTPHTPSLPPVDRCGASSAFRQTLFCGRFLGVRLRVGFLAPARQRLHHAIGFCWRLAVIFLFVGPAALGCLIFGIGIR